MKNIIKIDNKKPVIVKRKRVAAYARVSAETERLQHSLSAQISYYSALIQNNPEWEYVGVYADSFVSGTSTKKRLEFQRLVEDCDNGKIDIVLCKSISRFARNTIDLLNTVRHLKDMGIEVRFEKENISSLSGDGELMLSLLASFAQEESHSISENCKWGIRKRFETGEVGTANKHILGYRYDNNLRKYIIVPEEAAIIREMYQMFLDGLSLRKICDNLNNEGYRTINGCYFQENSLMCMIRSEVYVGDIMRQKSYIVDPITKQKVKNKGELPKFYIEDSHEAIIDRETYAKVQEEIARRTAKVNPTYFFTGKIKCGVCGNSYTRRQKNGKYISWFCRAKKEKGQTCNSVNFNESELMDICAKVLGIEEFSEAVFDSRVSELVVLPNGDIEFRMKNGKKEVWHNLKITKFKRHITTITDCFKGKLVCACCGSEYHRVIGNKRVVYWYCAGRKYKNTGCTNANYADYILRNISASVLGLKEFNERKFDSQIEKLEVDGETLIFHFYDGRAIKWQK